MAVPRVVAPVWPIIAVAASSVAACGPDDARTGPPADQATLAIESVTVIPMDGEQVLGDMTVLVGDGRVLAVQPAGEAEADIPDGAVRVDGRGRFLIPGLNDMHVHFQDSSALGRFIATGVTGVRVLWGGPHRRSTSATGSPAASSPGRTSTRPGRSSRGCLRPHWPP